MPKKDQGYSYKEVSPKTKPIHVVDIYKAFKGLHKADKTNKGSRYAKRKGS